ncbi:MAG: D-alanyl-D-alanine carboxypeptidase [Pyrinomonas sp.]|uniref:M15 family metallopeptidase n=1 Tax=Pyrinomonas sp. TaxID=2080306 RepID=UPI003321D0E4
MNRLFAIVLLVFALPGQQLKGPSGPISPTVEATVVNEDASRALRALLATAAEKNASLARELIWNFGGRMHRGVEIYVPLIAQTIGCESSAATVEFAGALSAWQARVGLPRTGVLDEETVHALISSWQEERIRDRQEPPLDQLVVAPPSDFFDPDRPDELRRVEKEAYDAYKRMFAAALADPSSGLARDQSRRYLKIISAFRSREYQERLRRMSPRSGRIGLAINSPHFTGRALDLYVGGAPVDTDDVNRAMQTQTPIYRWLVRNARRFGFVPYFYEPWHWEYRPELTTASANKLTAR